MNYDSIISEIKSAINFSLVFLFLYMIQIKCIPKLAMNRYSLVVIVFLTSLVKSYLQYIMEVNTILGELLIL